MTLSPFPATHSTLAPIALARALGQWYSFTPPISVSLLNRWLSDVYLVRTGLGPYIFKVYRAHWRSRDDIEYELNFVEHVARWGIAVSTPLRRRDGAWCSSFPAIEGPRLGVLFTFAPGRAVELDAETSRLYGQTAARLHAAAEDFSTDLPRFALDLDHLVRGPLAALTPFLEDRRTDLDFLAATAERLVSHVLDLAEKGLAWGPCHGDLHGGNIHQTDGGVLTLFDFDCCGPGWHAYDLAVFHWSVSVEANQRDLWDHFVAGYTSIRPLADVDLKAVPVFVSCRAFWFAGLLASNADDLGSGWLRDYQLDRLMAFLKRTASELI